MSPKNEDPVLQVVAINTFLAFLTGIGSEVLYEGAIFQMVSISGILALSLGGFLEKMASSPLICSIARKISILFYKNFVKVTFSLLRNCQRVNLTKYFVIEIKVFIFPHSRMIF